MRRIPSGLAALTAAALLSTVPGALAQDQGQGQGRGQQQPSRGQDQNRPAAPGQDPHQADRAQTPTRGQEGAEEAMPDFSKLDDAGFARMAAVGGLYEVTSSRLVQGRTQSQQIQQFAQQMIEDHNRANRELVTLAEQKQLEVPHMLDQKHQQMIERLTNLKGAEFDREYLRQQLKAHVETVAMFQAKSQNAQDPDVQAWARKTLPALQHHLEMAQSMSGAQPGAAGAAGVGTRPGGAAIPAGGNAPGRPGGAAGQPGAGRPGGASTPGGLGTPGGAGRPGGGAGAPGGSGGAGQPGGSPGGPGGSGGTPRL